MATTGGQTLNDRLNAARYALAGQGLARVVCKFLLHILKCFFFYNLFY